MHFSTLALGLLSAALIQAAPIAEPEPQDSTPPALPSFTGTFSHRSHTHTGTFVRPTGSFTFTGTFPRPTGTHSHGTHTRPTGSFTFPAPPTSTDVLIVPSDDARPTGSFTGTRTGRPHASFTGSFSRGGEHTHTGGVRPTGGFTGTRSERPHPSFTGTFTGTRPSHSHGERPPRPSETATS